MASALVSTGISIGRSAAFPKRATGSYVKRDNRSSNRRPKETERAFVLDEFQEGMVQVNNQLMRRRLCRTERAGRNAVAGSYVAARDAHHRAV